MIRMVLSFSWIESCGNNQSHRDTHFGRILHYNRYKKNRTGHGAPSPVFSELRIIVRCISACKAVWPCNVCKACCAGDNNAVCAAAAMDDQEIAVCIPAADDADVGIVRVEHQIARLRIAPWDVRAIAVLRCRAAAAPRIVAAVCCVIECPIDEPRTV